MLTTKRKRPRPEPVPTPTSTPTPPPVVTDARVKNVCLVAPNIVALTFVDLRVQSFSLKDDWFDQQRTTVIGDNGAAWQAGPWTVQRSTGAYITVQRANRCSTPAGQNYYDVGWAGNTHDDLLDVEHVIYLTLADNVGAGETLCITGPSSFAHSFAFNDMTTVTPALQVNQVGYAPKAAKRYAYVSWHLGDGGSMPLVNFPVSANILRNGALYLQNVAITPRSALDSDAGTEVRQIDLGMLPADDNAAYRVYVPGVGVSWPFKINARAVRDAAATIMRGLTHNRWAGDLNTTWTSWARPQDHLNPCFASDEIEGKVYADGVHEHMPEGLPKIDGRVIKGGHHDAGDYDMRGYHYMIALLLMQVYEACPPAFTDGQFAIPESGNGTPDLLDEILWSIALWEQLQDADGGVRTGVEAPRHPLGLYFANEDQLDYWMYSSTPIHTMRCAGLFAQASRLIAPFNADKSAELLSRAIHAYDYAVANGITGSLGGPVIYAAGELHLRTGNPVYASMRDAAIAAVSPVWSNMPEVYDRDFPWSASFTEPAQPTLWAHVMGAFSLLSLSKQTTTRTNLINSCNRLANVIETRSAHRTLRPVEYASPQWGKGVAQGQYITALLASAQLNGYTQREYDTLSLAADYVFGCNPLGRVWVTGLGQRPPIDPCHADSLVFKKQGVGVIPGIPVYGPVMDYNTGGYNEYALHVTYPLTENLPVMRRFGDAHTLIESNEFTTPDTHATLVQLILLLCALGT